MPIVVTALALGDGDVSDDPEACVPFADAVMAHPHWQLQVGEAWQSCMRSDMGPVLTISDQPDLVWDQPGMPLRHLPLTEPERAALGALWHLDCAQPAVLPEAQLPGTFIVARAGLRSGPADLDLIDGARIAQFSPMSEAIQGVFAAARARYVAHRLAGLGDLRAEIEIREELRGWPRRRDRYHATLIGRRLEIRRGDRVQTRVDLQDDEVVDIADWARALPDEIGVPDPDLRGHVLVDGRRVSVAETWQDVRPLWPVQRALSDARFADEH
ncbi:MAG: hypothetical protein K8W52_30455 [Deltaproteobacteria bacterium]|nr:hypothetical protein [Deltaproteobacteria bacterium]